MKSIHYVGMDVHSSSYTLCSYNAESGKAHHVQTVEPDYLQVVKYLQGLRQLMGEEAQFVCGYEAGCMGYTLYHQLSGYGIECVILAPSTMAVAPGDKRIKNDKRDAATIAKCLAYQTYSAVHVPTEEDEQVKEYIRMRDDQMTALKICKQQILAFCLRHGHRFTDSKNWTARHLTWLRTLAMEPLHREVLDEYLLSYDHLADKLKRLDLRIEELAAQDRYQERVKKLSCFLGVKSHTALAVIAEVSDFHRFPCAGQFAAFLGLVPREQSSGEKVRRYGITKAGNSHLRRLLVESAQAYGRGKIGYKSKAVRARQEGNAPQVIAYADKGNQRLRRKFYKMVMDGARHNVAKTAIARELACFMWGMMTDHMA